MKLLIGLGNPGDKYRLNRHNVGHMFVEFLQNSSDLLPANSFKLIKTDCYMNVSGNFVYKRLHQSPMTPQDLIIAHDDLDIPFGQFKIQLARGPKIHNGITSIEERLGTDEFWRVRIGIDARAELGARPSGEAYVLSNFTPGELTRLPEVFAGIATRLESVYNTNT